MLKNKKNTCDVHICCNHNCFHLRQSTLRSDAVLRHVYNFSTVELHAKNWDAAKFIDLFTNTCDQDERKSKALAFAVAQGQDVSMFANPKLKQILHFALRHFTSSVDLYHLRAHKLNFRKALQVCARKVLHSIVPNFWTIQKLHAYANALTELANLWDALIQQITVDSYEDYLITLIYKESRRLRFSALNDCAGALTFDHHQRHLPKRFNKLHYSSEYYYNDKHLDWWYPVPLQTFMSPFHFQYNYANAMVHPNWQLIDQKMYTYGNKQFFCRVGSIGAFIFDLSFIFCQHLPPYVLLHVLDQIGPIQMLKHCKKIFCILKCYNAVRLLAN